MPLTKENYEHFYLGNGAEHKIISELFLHGFEAHKFNPDIGVDLLVTNRARRQFHDAEEVSHYLQIKSTFLINNQALFFLSPAEYDFLVADEKITAVFCYFSPVITAEPKSFDRGVDEPWWESEEASFMRHLYETEFAETKKERCLSQLDFKGFEMKYFWLNSAQLKKAVEERLFTKTKTGLNMLKIEDGEDQSLRFVRLEERLDPAPEITNIYYLLKPSRSLGRLDSGDFLRDHY
jgi:hypothetical protein